MIRRALAAFAFVTITGTSCLFAAVLAPGLPWYAWAFAVAFWALLLLRRRKAPGDALPADPNGLRFSGFHGGGL